MPGAAARCARVDLSAGRATRSPSRVERRALPSRSRVASRAIRSPRPVGRPGDALAFARGYPDASLAFAGGQAGDALAFARGYPDASLAFAGGQAGDALAFETVARVAPARVGSKARGTPVAGVSPCRSAVHNGRATLAKMLSSAVRWIV